MWTEICIEKLLFEAFTTTWFRRKNHAHMSWVTYLRCICLFPHFNFFSFFSRKNWLKFRTTYDKRRMIIYCILSSPIRIHWFQLNLSIWRKLLLIHELNFLRMQVRWVNFMMPFILLVQSHLKNVFYGQCFLSKSVRFSASKSNNTLMTLFICYLVNKREKIVFKREK